MVPRAGEKKGNGSRILPSSVTNNAPRFESVWHCLPFITRNCLKLERNLFEIVSGYDAKMARNPCKQRGRLWHHFNIVPGPSHTKTASHHSTLFTLVAFRNGPIKRLRFFIPTFFPHESFVEGSPTEHFWVNCVYPGQSPMCWIPGGALEGNTKSRHDGGRREFVQGCWTKQIVPDK